MKKAFIEKLYAEKAKNDSNSEDLANTLNILSKTVFGDINRFVFELLQNADDSPRSNGNTNLDVVFHLFDNYLLFYHNGRHFDDADVKGISRVGSRDSRKDRELEKTGYKGIGFKSVFRTSDCVQIISNGYNFKFDKDHYVWKEDKTYPWQVIPIWSEEIPSEIQSHIDPAHVNTIIKIHQRETIYKEILDVFDDCQIILFLRNITSIKFLRNNVLEFEIKKNSLGHKLYNLLYNNHLKSCWYISDSIAEISESLRDKLFKLSDEECPVKLKEAQKTKITFAALITDGNIQTLENAIIYNYLPTKVKYDFPYIVNSDFITNAERTQLLSNEWNEFLFYEIAKKQFDFLIELHSTKFKFDILRLLKSKFSTYSIDKLKSAFNLGLSETISNTPFIPDILDEKLLKASDCLIDSLGYSKHFPHEHIISLFPSKPTLINPELKNSKKLLDFGACEFSSEDIERLLQSKEFVEISTTNTKFNLRFIAFLNKKIEPNEKLKDFKFILDSNKNLQPPKELYFPIDSNLSTISFTQLSFVNEELYNSLKEHREIVDWLIKLELKYPKDIEILRKSIIKMIAENGIAENNTIVITRFIYKLFRNGELTDNDYTDLRKIKLITNNGMQIASDIYLSDIYNPILKLEKLVSEQSYVSEKYVDNRNEIESWKNFFLRLNVKEKITVIKYDKIERTRLSASVKGASEYLTWIDNNGFYDSIYFPYRNSGQHSISNFRYFYFLNHLKSFDFSKLFWDILLNDWSSYSLNDPKTKYNNYRGSDEIPDYLSYFVRNFNSIPAIDGKCYKSQQVYAPKFKNIIKEKYPVADFKSSLLSKEQINYLGLKQFLEIDNCILLLKDAVGIELNVEVKKQIFSIYEEILKSYTEGNRITIDISKMELLTLNNTFKSIEKLHCFNIKSLTPPVNSESFIQLPDSFNEKDRSLFCSIFKISIVNYSDLVFTHKNIQLDNSLKQKLTEVSLFLSIILSHKNSSSFTEEYTLLVKKIEKTDIYRSDLLSLTYTGQDNDTIFSSNITTWHVNNCFYFSGDWKGPLTLYSLCSLLCSYLNVEDIDRELALFLQINVSEIKGWLVEKGYGLPDVPALKLDLDTELPNADTIDVAEESISAIYFEDAPVQESFVPEIEAHLANTNNVKVEQVTFESVNYNSISKYHAKIEDDTVKLDIGRWSEEYVYNYLKSNTNYSFVNWLNKDKESYNPYDFIVIENQQEKYIEVKGTPSSDKGEFYISKSEWIFMFEQKDNYMIFRLFNAGRKDGVEIKVLQEPYLLIQNGKLMPDLVTVLI